MTTKKAEVCYESAHIARYAGCGTAVYNPYNVPVSELPVIYGFNNGGTLGWMEAILLTEDGTCLGGQICSSEAYMPHDLGILEGTRPDRHEKFRKHYPNGYRMEFVGYNQVQKHEGLMNAIRLVEESNGK